MKIVCDSCATKYSIADDKVRGKVFKIRCKKCSHIIVVKGTEASDDNMPTTIGAVGGWAEAQASGGASGAVGRGYDASADGAAGNEGAIWHLVVNREQLGPISPAEVQRRFAAGEIDGETYAWKEGFGDWLRLAAIPELAELVGASSEPPSDALPAESTQRPQAGDLFAGANLTPSPSSGGSNDDEADLFGSPAAAPRPSSHAASPAQQRRQAMPSGIFASAEPPSSASGLADSFSGGGSDLGVADSLAANSPSARVDVRPMAGQRNENSVLFSLNNLQALSMSNAAPAAASATNGGGRAGYADRAMEGSGLIDIRAMAATHLGAARPAASDFAKGDPLDDVPLFSPVSAAAPLLVPMMQAPQVNKTILYALLAVAALLIVGIVLVLVVVLRQPKAAPVVPGAAGSTVAENAPPAAGEQHGSALPSGVAKPATAPPVNPAAAREEAPAPAAVAALREPARSASREPARPARNNGGGNHVAEPAPAPRAPPAPAAATHKGGGGDDLDALLGGAAPGPSHAPAAAAAPAPAAAASSLSTSQVKSGFNNVSGSVHSCFNQYHVPGMAIVSLRIEPSGAPSGVSVTGPLAGTPEGSCVASAVRGARWPASSTPLSIKYPFPMH